MPPASVSVLNKGLRSRQWLLSYKTSSTLIDGRPVDILHDFYIPALRLAVRYDRVAGYFRSSSLAAASQGFSVFVGREGRMRLIVGADLDPEDVRAVLAGDARRLAERLNGELDGAAARPEGVQNGVRLLAWMVARGHLEVRVAFRVHRETGEPLPFDAMDDGYVHEKWFILQDEFGNRLYGAGTLNESKTALLLNAENIDVHCDWWGETDRRRVDEAVESFENLWCGRVPHVPVMTLPEAVRRRLIRLAEDVDRPVEIDGSSAAPRTVAPPSALELLRFAVLRDAPKMPGGRFVGMETAPVAPWPHQAVVVRRLVETWPYSYLLCDEVGLGKTIEAGLAFRCLYLSGLARRILVAAPASLTPQWQRQMASKLLLPFGRALTGSESGHEYISPVEETRSARSIFDPDLVIVSTGLLARRERAEGLTEAEPFDVALVDEAHAVRRRNPSHGCTVHPDFGHLYVHIRDYLRPQARSLWLATATPMQIDPVEVCDLLALTNRVGAFQYDPSLVLQYYDILGKLVHRQEPTGAEWDFLRGAVRAVKAQDPLLWRFAENSVIDGRYRVAVRWWLEDGRIPKGRDRELMRRLLFSVSPLSRVMLRHNRRLLEIYRENGQLDGNLARRKILPMPGIEFEPPEARIYHDLENYCKELGQKLQAGKDSQTRQMVSFLKSFMRLRFASSFYALKETLSRRLRKVEATLRRQLTWQAGDEPVASASVLRERLFEGEDDEDDRAAAESLLKNRTPDDLEWERKELLKICDDIDDLTGPSSKMRVLLDVLDERRDRQTGRIRQTVIFTRFYDTLTDIVYWLRQRNPDVRIGTYSGRGAERAVPGSQCMLSVDREEVKQRFLQGEIDVLVCTDAAAEGLNLQTADLLVNFDLGWNPMKIEQRIGRIDRIGQKHDEVHVLNLCYVGSAEETVYIRLLERLAEANRIVGTQQISLLPVEPEEFEQLADGKLSLEELNARALQRIDERRRRTESMEIPAEELYAIYSRMAETTAARAPVTLTGIWQALSSSRYLKDLGCVTGEEPARPTLTVYGIEGVPDGAVLTVSRELYERGLSDGGRRVHFASYGDPCFDALLEHVGRFGLPSCVRRISVSVPEPEGVEMAAYAAACTGGDGLRRVKLITRWDDLDNLSLAEGETLAEAEIEPLRSELERMAREEFGPCMAAERIQRENVRAALAQEMLNFLVIRSLLSEPARFAAEGALLGSVLREVESLFDDRDIITLPDLPADYLRAVKDDLLFECRVPTIGDKATVKVSRILGRTSVDAARRLIDSMKKHKSKPGINQVLLRLQREAETRRKHLH
ncbi:MAG: helicase-related protein [Bacillota bacterium]